ncbi:MAG: ABC transporter ATP-binding protein/permease [Kiritimatiellae bacterium]|nr:ABC transporter ATP-binding protein/permease [Kiritimatiellia bacterium]
MSKVLYQKEFFDREYTRREAYARVWKYARKYRFRLVVGVLAGMCTAGTMLPLFQVVRPALQHVESHDNAVREAKAESAPAPAADAPAPKPVRAKNAFDKQIEKNSKLPSWYPEAEYWAAKLGIQLQTEQGGMAGALLLIVVVVVPLLAALRLGMTYLNHYCLSWAGAHAVADLRQEMLEHVQRQGMQFFGRVDVGQLMTRISADPQQIQTILTTILTEVALAPFEILVAVGYIVWYAIVHDMLPTLMLICVGFPLFVFPVHMLGRTIKKWAKRTMERGSMIGSKIHEVLTCVKVVKSYNAEQFENERYAATNRYLLKSTMKGLRVGLMVGPSVETVGILLICAFLVWCFAMGVKISDVVPMLAPLLIIYKPVKQISKLQVQIETTMASLTRIFSVLDLRMELPENPSAKPKASFDDKVVFENVSFRYDAAERDAVKDVSFELPRGKMVAVVGSTGSGKSTLSGLLARFYDPTRGRVAMDGTDLRDLRTADLHALVGAVTQEALLFNDTIEENIRYGSPDATHEQVVAAAKMANAHDFIMAQPEGYGRIAGEKGFALSGGERQRVSIARAILRNPPILILDEATSALDTVTEKLVQEALDNLMQNRTTFAIAHRLSTIRHADLILVMQDGEIVERGTHDELYALDGVYRKLCDMQHQK